MSIRSLYSPRLVAVLSTLVLVASLALPFTSARASSWKCDDINIIHCGFDTKNDWQHSYNNGDGTNSATNLKQIYSSQGVTVADMMGSDTVEGFVTRDSKVTLASGNTVASNVWSSGRSSLGFDNAVNLGNGVWFHPTGVTFAAGVDKIPALVNMKGGKFNYAIMKSCGNIVKKINKPFGIITKQVKDNTTKSQLVAADDAAHALGVNDGDTMEYRVTVGNNGTGDMTNTVFTDDLPTGLALASDPNKRHLESNLGTIPAGGARLVTIIVKATTSDGQIIDNKACFAANNGQKGCDHAVIKVKKKSVPVSEVSFMCVSLTATPAANGNVHFVAQADATKATIQRYTITLSTGEQIAVVSSAKSVTADKSFVPGTYTAELRVLTSAGTTPQAPACKASFTVAAPPTGGGTLPTPTETPRTGAESALGGLLGMGGLGYAARGYLRSRRSLVETLKNKQ